MDKKHTDFLRECEAEIAALKERLSALETRLTSFQEQAAQDIPAPEEEVDFTGVAIGLEDIPDAEPVAETVAQEPAAQPAAEPQPQPEPEPAPAPRREPYSWEKARPGAPVKNIRSGISLLERAVFIGTLFKEDFAAYDATIAALNGMNSLDEAIAYIQAHFPDWNLGSDAVFSFMMAVRKKLG